MWTTRWHGLRLTSFGWNSLHSWMWRLSSRTLLYVFRLFGETLYTSVAAVFQLTFALQIVKLFTHSYFVLGQYLILWLRSCCTPHLFSYVHVDVDSFLLADLGLRCPWGSLRGKYGKSWKTHQLLVSDGPHCRLQLKGDVFLTFFRFFQSFLRKFICFLIDFNWNSL